MREYITADDWDLEENEDGPSELSFSFTCPKCGEYHTRVRSVDDEYDPHESGDSIECECECGCEMEVELG